MIDFVLISERERDADKLEQLGLLLDKSHLVQPHIGCVQLQTFRIQTSGPGSKVPVQHGRKHQKLRVLSLTVVEEVVLVGARQHRDDEIVSLGQDDAAMDPKEVSPHTRGLVPTNDLF